jgi:hypothetical protein
MAGTRLGGRRFTILDGMILIGTTGCGLAWTAGISRKLNGLPMLDGSWDKTWEWVAVITALGMPCLIAWTLTLPILRMLKPRPSCRRTASQPGMTACLSASLGLMALALVFAGVLVSSSIRGKLPGQFWDGLAAGLAEWMLMTAPLVGFGVAVAWALLAVQGRWRCEAGWIDRAGRAVGISWLVMIPVIGGFLLTRL